MKTVYTLRADDRRFIGELTGGVVKRGTLRRPRSTINLTLTVLLSRSPYCEAESCFVDQVSQVVNQVQ